MVRSMFPSQKCTKHTNIGPLLEVEMSKKCTPLWREAQFQVKSVKKSTVSDQFWKLSSRKKSTPLWCEACFPSQKVYKTHQTSAHFWKLRCRKSARRCGAKHNSKSKVSKIHGLRPVLEVELSKKCTPLWCEACFQVKSVQNTPTSAHFWKLRCRKVHAVVVRSTFPSQKCQKPTVSDHFWKLSCRKKCTRLWREAYFQVQMYKTL